MGALCKTHVTDDRSVAFLFQSTHFLTGGFLKARTRSLRSVSPGAGSRRAGVGWGANPERLRQGVSERVRAGVLFLGWAAPWRLGQGPEFDLSRRCGGRARRVPAAACQPGGRQESEAGPGERRQLVPSSSSRLPRGTRGEERGGLLRTEPSSDGTPRFEAAWVGRCGKGEGEGCPSAQNWEAWPGSSCCSSKRALAASLVLAMGRPEQESHFFFLGGGEWVSVGCVQSHPPVLAQTRTSARKSCLSVCVCVGGGIRDPSCAGGTGWLLRSNESSSGTKEAGGGTVPCQNVP